MNLEMLKRIGGGMTEKRTIRQSLNKLCGYNLNADTSEDEDINEAEAEIQEIRKAEVMGVEELNEIISDWMTPCKEDKYISELSGLIHAEMIKRIGVEQALKEA